MANPKLKIALFGGAVVLALILIISLVVHRSSTRDRICKNSGEVYYESNVTSEGSCLRVGTQGPCGNNMALFRDSSNTSIGVCKCDSNHFDRALVYNEDLDQCYFIFTQAYCEPGQWLTIVKSEGPVCANRSCEESTDAESEIVPLADGRCVELGKYDNITCNKSQVIRFFKKKIYPRCTSLGTSIGSVGVPGTDCPDGHFSTGAGHCQPDFDFD